MKQMTLIICAIQKSASIIVQTTGNGALIADPELPGIISREDYEKAGIEELAEWKNV
jgi:hypothetical protein